MTKISSDGQVSQYIFDALQERFPDAHCELVFHTPFELLIATILSAQCTDERVNLVTASLFAEANTPEAIMNLGQSALENKIRSLGLFHNKAKNILAACKVLVENFEGEVPADLELLRALPGVGRKTANVVVSNAFGIPAIAVDTHVFRVANRLGIAHEKTPEKVEEELMLTFPRERWSLVHHLMIFHGRRICSARKPRCEECPLTKVCKTYPQFGQVILPEKREG
ncbi:endonuclease III [Desulfosporosinus nitroreducens]|uniref:Endonuclease III n=1 Tax=Desulfosporosinus nitroreducens TaxID=2018668 RepID=A0ABT8QJS1_9FIRM|nr:endonuclease III [Desulfosporosinus nitroreducens]MCO1600443.1 endonuclease III [Desulfosporosinus nitroreducens]MDO0821531.1 endonuclease III [Desulfosporosinus nitroreducens]